MTSIRDMKDINLKRTGAVHGSIWKKEIKGENVVIVSKIYFKMGENTSQCKTSSCLIEPLIRKENVGQLNRV